MINGATVPSGKDNTYSSSDVNRPDMDRRSDWNEENIDDPSYIQNKPDVDFNAIIEASARIGTQLPEMEALLEEMEHTDVGELTGKVIDLKSDSNNYDEYVVGVQNLIGQATYKKDYYLDNNGVEHSYSGFAYTSLIPVVGGAWELLIKPLDSGSANMVRIHGYNSSGEWVQMLFGESLGPATVYALAFDVPSGIEYIRISYFATAKALIALRQSTVANSIKKVATSVDDLTDVIIPKVNVFNKDDTNIIHSGYFRSGSTGNLVQNAEFTELYLPVDELTQYICTGTGYMTSFYDKNNNKIGTSSDYDGSANYVFNTPLNCAFVSLNFRHAMYPISTYMVVKGNSLPSTFVKYGDAILKNILLTENGNNVADVINSVADEYGAVYYVGADKQYTTFTSCIRALANDATKKTIIIDAGEYDIYDEIGGDAFADTVGDSLWTNWNDIIPPNTKIIGDGHVVFNFNITSDNPYATDKLSPINVKWSVELENITINAVNCRYGIHDDGSSDSTANYSKHKYRNVVVNKSGIGYAQAFGSGIGKGTIMDFDGCIFKSAAPFSVHSNVGSYDGLITFRDCAFDCTNSANSSMRFSGMASYTGDQHIPVNILNCYMNQKIVIQREDASITTEVNPFKLTVVRSSDVTIDTSRYTAEELRYEPVVYQ